VSWSTWEDVAIAHDNAPGSTSTNGLVSTANRSPLKGEELAALFGNVRHVPHNYFPLPVNDFKAGLTAAVGDEAARELARLYEWFASDGREYLAHESEESKLALEPASDWIARQTWS
jgi:hypothetical protein